MNIYPEREQQYQVTLEDIYDRLLRPLITYFIFVGGFGAWYFIPIQYTKIVDFSLFLSILIMGVICRRKMENITFVRYMMTWSLTLILIIAIWVHPESWVPYLSIIIILISTILLPGSQWFVDVLLIIEITYLSIYQHRIYHLPSIIALTITISFISLYTARSLFIALQWVLDYWNSLRETLEETRRHRAELARTVQSLNQANYILKRTEAELNIARKLAEEAGRTKQQFAANISHELRTPLSIIYGFSEIMYLNPEVYGGSQWPSSLRGDVYQIYSNSQHLLRMIDDILVISKFDLAEFLVSPEPTNMSAFLQESAEIVRNLFKKSSAQFIVEIPADLPELSIDRTRIRQVVFNLINNAMHFSEVQENGFVKLGASVDGYYLRIEVQDNGQGIPEHELPNLFNTFYQGKSNVKEEKRGTGLGLAISKRFVEAHGGMITVESVYGEGSTFYFKLPLNVDDISKYEDLKRENDSINKLDFPCVLVSGLDSSLLRFFSRKFSTYEIVNADENIPLSNQVEYYHPLAVIINKTLKNSDLELADIPSSIPLIECSIPNIQSITHSSQVIDHIEKPFSPGKLSEIIANCGPVKNIMVIDDEWGFVQLIKRTLEKINLSLQVSYTLDPIQGLNLLKEKQPDLLLLDINMPGMSGLEILEEMSGDEKLSKIPVLIITVDKMSDVKQGRANNIFTIRRSEGLNTYEMIAYIEAVLDIIRPGG